MSSKRTLQEAFIEKNRIRTPRLADALMLTSLAFVSALSRRCRVSVDCEGTPDVKALQAAEIRA